MAETERITVYADHVCPFCYLGRRSLERYRETRDRPLAIDWRPYDLRAGQRGPDGEIDGSIDDGKDEEYFERARRNVERLREEYGATEMLDVDEVPEVDSLDAQVASAHVREHHPDRWEPFDRSIYRAHWAEGRDIGDPSVLADLAADVGLDGTAVRDAVTDREAREAVFEAFERARRQGVTGVPTFVFEGHAARGAVPPDQLERLVEGT